MFTEGGPSRKAKLRRATQLIAASRKEIRAYKKWKRTVHLLQAGEKVWVVYWLLVESYLDVNVTARTRKEYAEMAEQREPLFAPLRHAAWGLHEYHYQGMSDPWQTISNAEYCFGLITRIRQKHGLY